MKKSAQSLISLALTAMILLPSISTSATTEVIGQINETVIESNQDKNKVFEESKDIECNPVENSNVAEENEEEHSEEILSDSGNEEELGEDKDTIEINEYKLENNDIVGEIYEILESEEIIQSYSVEEFEREEFNLKYPTIIDSMELKKKTEAEYEIALAYSDGSYTYLDSTGSFEEAKAIVDNFPAQRSVDMVLPTIIDSKGKVVYSTRTMGRIWKHIDGKAYSKFDINTNIYSNSTLSNAYTYINQGYIDDVPVIEYNDKSAKIQVNGYNGWINKDINSGNYDLVLVPINQVTNPSYYSVKEGALYHFISSNMTDKVERGTTFKIGPAPEYLKEDIKYLSYDGRYFYNGSNIALGLDNLISDLQSGHKNNSVNANNAYYNYYNYLPFRSKTSYKAEDLNKFIEANTNATSKLRGTGQAFIDAQNNYGVNALLALGIGINESGWGESSIAHYKNNIFGLNAVDSSPGESANYFKTVRDSIIEFSRHYISRGYSDPADWRYYGGFLGNKNMGANIKYASDPFWGEKASAYAFLADYYLSGGSLSDLKDFNALQIIMYTGENEVRDTSNTLLYKINSSVSGYGGYPGSTAIVTSKEEKIVNGIYSLEIYPERNTPINGGGEANKYHGNYDWNSKAYIKSKNIIFINVSNIEILPVDPSCANKWKEVAGKTYYYDNNGFLCKGWKNINGYWYFFDQNTGERKIGWLTDGDKKYFLHNDGKMATGLTEISGKLYLFDSSGAMLKGWQKVGSDWYYLLSSGEAKKGWIKLSGVWYYLNNDGKMATGLSKIDGQLYLLAESGAMLTGWQKVGSDWYYFLSSGEAGKGWKFVGGKWYYLKDDGKMATGWIQVDGKKYYLYQDGSMAANTTINGVYVDGSGAAR